LNTSCGGKLTTLPEKVAVKRRPLAGIIETADCIRENYKIFRKVTSYL